MNAAEDIEVADAYQSKSAGRSHVRRPGLGQDCQIQRVALAGLRPPPWLALPPLLAISRCFAGSIAANPRFEPPLLIVAMALLSPVLRRTCNARFLLLFTMLINVRKQP